MERNLYEKGIFMAFYTARGACMKVFPERNAYVECAAHFFLQRFLSSGGALDSAEVRQKLKLTAGESRWCLY